MNWFDKFLKLFYFGIAPLLFISYCLEPWTQDVRIYLGAAKVTLLTPGFPMSLDTVWESRFVGHRLFYYVLEAVNPFDGWVEQVWLKTLVAIVMIAVIYYFSKQVACKWAVPFDYVFIVTFTGLFSVNTFMIFAAEAHSVIIGLLMIAMLLDDRPIVNGLSGLLTLPLMILKGLPILLVPIAILVVYMICPKDWQQRIVAATCALPIAIAAWFSMAYYFPHFISDIFLNTKMAHIGFLNYIDITTYFFKYGLGVIGFMPIILIGLFVTFLLLSLVRKEHMKDLAVLGLMWLVAALYVLIISEFFYYHFYLALIPAVLTIIYFLKLYEHPRTALVMLVSMLLIIYCAVVASWSIGLAGAAYPHWAGFDKNATQLISEYPDLLTQPSTLYLDDGLAAYYFPTRSACRYVGALPIQRNRPNWNMTATKEYQDLMDCALDYTGKYVIANDQWMNLSYHTALKYKLDNQYNMTAVHYWNLYIRS